MKIKETKGECLQKEIVLSKCFHKLFYSKKKFQMFAMQHKQNKTFYKWHFRRSPIKFGEGEKREKDRIYWRKKNLEYVEKPKRGIPKKHIICLNSFNKYQQTDTYAVNKNSMLLNLCIYLNVCKRRELQKCKYTPLHSE